MKILITGGSGFVGQHLLSALASDNVDIRIISRKSGLEFRNKNIQPEVFLADITDILALEKAFIGIDIVINLAAELRNESDFEKTNIQGVKYLVALTKKYNVKKFIQLSSVGVVGMQYSSKHFVVDETTVCNPKNGYEKSKLESESILFHAFSEEKGRLVMLRPTNIFGDHHPRNTLLNFLQTIKNKKRLICTSNATVNYVYVNDLVSTIRHFIFNKADSTVYNVGEASSFEKFFHESSRLIGTPPRLTILPHFCFAIPEAFGYLGIHNLKAKLRTLSNRVVYSDKKLQKEVPGIYSYGNEKGLQCTIDYYQSNGKL